MAERVGWRRVRRQRWWKFWLPKYDWQPVHLHELPERTAADYAGREVSPELYDALAEQER